MIERRRHLLDEVFCPYDACPSHCSFPEFECFVHRDLLGLPGLLLFVVAWPRTAPGLPQFGFHSIRSERRSSDQRHRQERRAEYRERRDANPAHGIQRTGLPQRKIEKYSFPCSQFRGRHQRRQRRDDAQFRCAVRSRIKRAPAESAASPGALSAGKTRNSLSVIPRNSPWRIPRVAGGKQRQRHPIRGPTMRCDSSSQYSVWRDWRGPSSRMQRSRPPTARKGVELFWRSRGKSQ
jgi:hypothetical protein